MKAPITRREFLAASAAGAAGALLAPSAFASDVLRTRAATYAVGITVDTRPDWNGAQNFIRSIDEASEIGYRMIETFRPYVAPWIDANNPQGLRDELQRRNLGLITVSGAGNWTDPAQRAAAIESNLEIARFIQQLGCSHLKLNIGGEQPRGRASQTAETYRTMAAGFNEIGRRLTDMGMKFAPHAHLSSAFETRQDIDAIMELTDPRHVWFVLDTGQITMAGMDPVQLTRDYVSRIVEYHLKDVHAEDKGGTRRVMGRMVVPAAGAATGGGQPQEHPEYPGIPRADLPASIIFRDRYFYELGKGGVDFPAILKILEANDWRGYLTVELDSTITTSKASATVSKQYLERILGLEVERPNQRPGWHT